MRRPVVRVHLVGVELAGPTRRVVQPDGVRPIQEVLGRSGLDVAAVLVAPGVASLAEVPVVLAILASQSVPEGQVMGVEGAIRDDRPVRHRRPVDTVGRFVDVETALCATLGDSLVRGVGLRVRVAVFERHEVIGARTLQDDVVILGSLELDQAQNGSGPLDAVGALGDTDDPLVGLMFVWAVDVPGPPVVHPE